MRLAVIGGRDFKNYELLLKCLTRWGSYPLGFGVIDEVVSGGAKGADSLAAKAAKELDIDVTEIIPDWDRFGKSAGFIRNTEIINSADAVLAFWDGTSRGTKDSIDKAIEIGLEVFIITYGRQRPSKLERPTITHRAKQHDVYIGRPSPYGNPFSTKDESLADYQVVDLQEALDRFEIYMRLLPEEVLYEWSLALKSKSLGCWCLPRKACHGTVIADVLEELYPSYAAIVEPSLKFNSLD